MCCDTKDSERAESVKERTNHLAGKVAVVEGKLSQKSKGGGGKGRGRGGGSGN